MEKPRETSWDGVGRRDSDRQERMKGGPGVSRHQIRRETYRVTGCHGNVVWLREQCQIKKLVVLIKRAPNVERAWN